MSMVFAPSAAAPVAATRSSPPLGWAAVWDEVDEETGFSVFYWSDTGDSFFLSDTLVESFAVRKGWRRAVVDISHVFGDLSGRATVRHWGRRGEITSSFVSDDGSTTTCGSWEARWKVLDPGPLLERFERAGLPPIKTSGQGTIGVCRTVTRDGSVVLTASPDLDVYWKTPHRRS